MKNHLLTIMLVLLVAGISACLSAPQTPPSTPTPTLASDKGRVVGTIQVRYGASAQPFRNYNLYLGETVKDNTGKDTFVGLDRVHSPRATTDDQGYFAFQNMTPGTYGLVLDTGNNAFLLLKPNQEKEEAIVVAVTPGKEVDLGTLLYDSLPIPPVPQPYPYPQP
jgi:hypothetical protein